MGGIKFNELNIDASSVSVQATSEKFAHDIHFEFSKPMPVSSTSVAIALSTLCGRAFKKVHYDFPVAQSVFKAIGDLTFADVSSSGDEAQIHTPRRGTLLSFSGGFDSLAAKALMPADTQLVSMDFGGRFARERQFFESFDTLRVTTNIVDAGLQKNSWSFMGIGAILASDFYRARFHTFGSILEASIDNLSLEPAGARNVTFPPFSAAGYENAPFALGLTEIGTLTALLKTRPDLVGESLLSLATPGEEKLYRKLTLARLVNEVICAKVELPNISAPESPRLKFGENFAVDLLALYVISKTGEVDARGLVADVPPDVTNFALKADMKFMERANPTLYENFPSPLWPALSARLAELDIKWYSEKDWDVFRKTSDVILRSRMS